MLPSSAIPSHAFRRVGVGIDTSRYGHYACFLGDAQQPAAAELAFAESAAGYAQLRQRLEQIVQRHGAVQFLIRLDAAGQYADNLLHFLHALATLGAAPSRLAASISCGDPQRNKNYRAALYGSKKSDPVKIPETSPEGEGVFIDFAHLKTQLTMAQLLDQLGLLARLRGSGPQRKGPCPLHRGDGRGRSFSVNLHKNVFHCFDAACGKKGDVIDLWASVNGMSLRQAAIDLVRTFHLEPAPE